MKNLILVLSLSALILSSCKEGTNRNASNDQFSFDGKTYSYTELAEIVSAFEESQNLNDIDSAYGEVSIPPDTGDPIDFDTALERMKKFRTHARIFNQPHGFAYGLQTIKELYDRLEAVNKTERDNGRSDFYTGIRIYVSKRESDREWNTILVGTRGDGRDVFTENKDWDLVDEPIYNVAAPCPKECP